MNRRQANRAGWPVPVAFAMPVTPRQTGRCKRSTFRLAVSPVLR